MVKRIILVAVNALIKLVLGLILILILLSGVGALLSALFDGPSYHARESQSEQALSQLLQQIQLGDTHEAVTRTFLKSHPKELEIIRYNDESWGIKMVSGGTFSIPDWRLHIDFAEDIVDAVYIRSVDGPYKPKGSPADKGAAPPVHGESP